MRCYDHCLFIRVLICFVGMHREDVIKLIGPRPFEEGDVAETLGEKGASGVSQPLGGSGIGGGAKGAEPELPPGIDSPGMPGLAASTVRQEACRI